MSIHCILYLVSGILCLYLVSCNGLSRSLIELSAASHVSPPFTLITSISDLLHLLLLSQRQSSKIGFFHFQQNLDYISTPSQQIIKSIFPSVQLQQQCWDDDSRFAPNSLNGERKLFTLETKLEVEIQWTFHFPTSILLLDQKGIWWLLSHTSLMMLDVWSKTIVELDFQYAQNLIGLLSSELHWVSIKLVCESGRQYCVKAAPTLSPRKHLRSSQLSDPWRKDEIW